MARMIHLRFPQFGRDLSMIRDSGKATYCLVIMCVKRLRHVAFYWPGVLSLRGRLPPRQTLNSLYSYVPYSMY